MFPGVTVACSGGTSHHHGRAFQRVSMLTLARLARSRVNVTEMLFNEDREC